MAGGIPAARSTGLRTTRDAAGGGSARLGLGRGRRGSRARRHAGDRSVAPRAATPRAGRSGFRSCASTSIPHGRRRNGGRRARADRTVQPATAPLCHAVDGPVPPCPAGPPGPRRRMRSGAGLCDNPGRWSLGARPPCVTGPAASSCRVAGRVPSGRGPSRRPRPTGAPQGHRTWARRPAPASAAPRGRGRRPRRRRRVGRQRRREHRRGRDHGSGRRAGHEAHDDAIADALARRAGLRRARHHEARAALHQRAISSTSP